LKAMTGYDTLPGCIGYYGRPLAPNNCKTCSCIELCLHISMRFIAKDDVKAILAKLQQIEQLLHG